MTSTTSIAEIVRRQIDQSENTVETIAEAARMSPGALRLLCEGTIKLPINRVSLLADALGLDKRAFIDQVMSEYLPDAWEAIRETLLAPAEGICQ